jgi:hypothetical protein
MYNFLSAVVGRTGIGESYSIIIEFVEKIF